MYVRMTGGRDRGEVKEFSVEDAQAMLRKGQAVRVNFDEADPLGKREMASTQLAEVSTPQLLVPTSRQPADAPQVMASMPPASGQKARKK